MEEVIAAFDRLCDEDQAKVIEALATKRERPKRWSEKSQAERDEVMRRIEELRKQIGPGMKGFLKPGQTWNDIARADLRY